MVVARTPWRRLVGLAFRHERPGYALLIPRCRSVHTFGMRFALDVAFLDSEGRVLRLERGVPPGRVLACRGAAAVLEAPVNMIPEMPETFGSKLRSALDPRVPIYRDTYNEYFVFILSAGGAAAGTQVPLYIVMALTDLWSAGVFVAACVVFELVVIFGLARPQMKPMERVGWVALWTFATAVLAICFYYLVAEPTL